MAAFLATAVAFVVIADLALANNIAGGSIRCRDFDGGNGGRWGGGMGLLLLPLLLLLLLLFDASAADDVVVGPALALAH